MEKSLYQITADQLELFNQIDELEGELTPELEESLKLNADNFQEKARGYIWKMKDLEDKNERIKKEYLRLSKNESKNTRLYKKLKETLQIAVLTFGGKKEVDTFELSIRKSKSIDVYDESLVPQEYKEIKTSETINKTEIKKAIESGLTVPGATIKENNNLQIK